MEKRADKIRKILNNYYPNYPATNEVLLEEIFNVIPDEYETTKRAYEKYLTDNSVWYEGVIQGLPASKPKMSFLDYLAQQEG